MGAVKLLCFQENMTVKEDPIKIREEKELEKRADQRKTVWRSICLSTTMRGREACRPHSIEKKYGSDFQQAADTVLLTAARACRQPEAQNRIQVSFSGAFKFLFW